MTYQKETWKIDRHIPVAIIGVILLQTFGMGWWAATMASRMSAAEISIARQDTKNERFDDKIATLEGNVIGLKAKGH